MATTTLNSDPRFGEQLQANSITLPATAFTFEIDFALPADWQLKSEGVPLVQYGTGSHSSSGFAISTWSDNFDVYIAGRRFDTTIAVSDFIGTSHRISITWDKATGTAKSYLDGVLVDTATVAQNRTISPNQPLTIGGGGGSEPNPILSLDDVRVFDHVRSASDIASFHDAALPGGQTGLAGYWQADGTGLPSAIGGAPLSLEQEPITIANLGALTIGVPASGEIATAATHDWYTVALEAGKTYTFALVGTGSALLDDPYLELHSAGGTTRLARADDGAPGSNSWFTFTPEASGTYILDAHAGPTDTGTYGISVAEGSSAVYDDAMGAGIIQGGSWSNERGADATVTFGFQITDPGERENFEPFNAVMQTATREILQLYADIANITFVDANPDGLTDAAQMLFSVYDEADGSGGHSHGAGNGDIHLNYGNRDEAPAGSYVWYTLLHEIGHSMGFSHPAIYSTIETAQFTTDSVQYSVLSYHGAGDTGGDFGATGSADTPMLLDILAMHETYGSNMTTRTGDTVYGFNATADNRLYDFAQNTDPGLAIWDAGGTDTLDVSGYSQNQTITLLAGEFSSVGGLTNNVAIAFGATIENAVGGIGDDEVWGNAAANVLTGGLGADTLRGDDGDDRLVGDGVIDSVHRTEINGLVMNAAGGQSERLRATSVPDLPTTALTVEMVLQFDAAPSYQWFFSFPGISYLLDPTNQGAPGLWIQLNGDWAYSEITLADLGDGDPHRVSFTWDSATGAFAHYLDGALIKSGTGFKQGATLAGTGTIEIDPSAGAIGDIRIFNVVRTADEIADNVYGEFANPTGEPGLVANWQVGGDGTVSDATGSIALTSTVTTPQVADLTYEYSHDDTLIGGLGNDTLDGGLGGDTMEGGAGNDVYTVDSVSDVVREVFGEGLDTVNSSVSITLGVGVENLNLMAGAGAGTGNALANHIVGNTVANTLYGLDGNDVLYGGLGNDGLFGGNHNDSLLGEDGKDVLYGGAGNDRLDGGRHNDSLRAETGNDFLTGSAGRDILYGGKGIDDFIYRSLADSGKTAAARDVIRDFSAHNSEDINLALIDANTRAAGNQRFKFIGTQAFDGDGAASAGALSYSHIGAKRLLVQGDVNGDGRADFSIEVDGVTSLQAADFIL